MASSTTGHGEPSQPCTICSNGSSQVYHYGNPCPFQNRTLELPWLHDRQAQRISQLGDALRASEAEVERLREERDEWKASSQWWKARAEEGKSDED